MNDGEQSLFLAARSHKWSRRGRGEPSDSMVKLPPCPQATKIRRKPSTSTGE